MEWSGRPPYASRFRTLGVIAGLVTLLVASGFAGNTLADRHMPGWAPPISATSGTGASQSGAAMASLSRGEGPAASHPSTLPVSPGGYTWTNLTSALPTSPSGRLTTMAWDASDGYVLLWGWDNLFTHLRDTWTYANGTWTNITSAVGNSPPGALYAVLAFDPSSQKVVFFSGENNTTWTYHHEVWTNITSTAGVHPPPLILESFVTDSTDNEAVLFGGQAAVGNALTHVTWVFKNGLWSNITSTAPFQFGRIVLPVAADDPADHGVLALGLAEWSNVTPYLYKSSTFLFSGGTWTNLTTNLPLEPPLQELAGFGYLPSISAAVLVEPIIVNSTGNFGSYIGVTWEFSHGVWKNVTAVTGPQPDTGVITASAVDPVDQTMLVFGGSRPAPLINLEPSTWLFSASPTVSASVSRAAVDSGQAVTLTGTVSGGASPTTTRWNFGDGTNSTFLSGLHSYASAGVFTATLTATDLVGHSVSASVGLVVNPALAVTAFATPTNPVNGTGVAFTSSQTGGTAPYTYAWTLGDGDTATTASLAHVYLRSGTYHVILNVTDSTGSTAMTSFSVVVDRAVPPPAPVTSTGNSVSLTSGTGLYLLLGIILLLVVVVVLGAMLAMRPRSPPGALTSYTTVPTSPGGVPPPGAGGPPPS